MTLTERLSSWQPTMLSVLRIVSALIFLSHGTSKLLGFPASNMQPDVLSMSWNAGVIELIGGLLLLIGLFSRFAAFIMSGEMAFAYWIAHAPQSIYPIQNGGDTAILYCFVFLYIVFAGPGPWSVDAQRGHA